MNNLEIFEKRHSVRKFKDEQIPEQDLKKIMEAAIKAPSGKNIQNWHFVVIENKEKIKQIAAIIAKKNELLASKIADQEKKEHFTRYLRFGTHFKDAPVLILVFVGDYPITGLEVMEEADLPAEEILKAKKAAPGIQNIGAAVENMLLAAAELGYGTCWMTSQNYAATEIENFVGFNEDGYQLAMMTPLGVPAKEPTSPPKKDLAEVVTWLK